MRFRAKLKTPVKSIAMPRLTTWTVRGAASKPVTVIGAAPPATVISEAPLCHRSSVVCNVHSRHIWKGTPTTAQAIARVVIASRAARCDHKSRSARIRWQNSDASHGSISCVATPASKPSEGIPMLTASTASGAQICAAAGTRGARREQ